jgi:hypothetical protein
LFNVKKENFVKFPSKLFLALSITIANVAISPVQAADIPLVTGDQWTKSTPEIQKAYLIGLVNLTQIDTAFSAGNPPTDAQSVLPRLVKGMQGQTLDSVREGLNKWYAANPGKLQRPVIETIWFEMAVPGLQKNK